MSDPRPAGLSHMTFIVADLNAMEEILVAVLGARKIYDSGQEQFSLSEERFYLVADADIWVAVMKGDPLPSRTYNHIAFKIEEADFASYRRRITTLGLDIRESRPRVAGEGRSLYFHDRDNHLFELHTGTLNERLARYAHGREPDSDSQPMSPNP